MTERLPRIERAYILTEPLAEIGRTVASRSPETGGILLGPPDRDVVTSFIFDAEGSRRASGATYTPHISSLQGQVDEIHRQHGWIIKGFVHSHPGSMRQLSSGDLHTIARYFREGEALPYFFAPIVWSQSSSPRYHTESNDLRLNGDRRLAFHVVHPEDGQLGGEATVPVRIIASPQEAPPSTRPLVPAARPAAPAAPKIHLERLKHRLRAANIRELRVDYRGRDLYAVEAALPDFELIFLFPMEVELFPPHIMVTPRSGGEPFRLSFPSTEWKISRTVSLEEKLAELVLEQLKKKLHVAGGGSERAPLRFGPAEGLVVCTDDEEEARAQGWVRHSAGAYEFHDIGEQYFARSGGLLSRSLLGQTALIAGCGSGGSYIAEQLVRSGVGRLILVDPDTVKFHNLCRSGYRIADVDLPKVQALARHLKNINPRLKVEAIATSIEEIETSGRLRGLVESAGLVIAGTDAPTAQKILGRYSYALHRPALFPGLYERAEGGEILLTWPDRKTPCYDCMLGFRGEARERLRGTLDYATGTLVAEPGLSADIHHLDSITVKLALGLLLQGVPPDERCDVRDLVSRLSDGHKHRTFVLSGHAPGFSIFGELHGDEAGAQQAYAYQTLWLDISARRRPSCDTCGTSPVPLHATNVINLGQIRVAPTVAYPMEMSPGVATDEALLQSEAEQLRRAEEEALTAVSAAVAPVAMGPISEESPQGEPPREERPEGLSAAMTAS